MATIEYQELEDGIHYFRFLESTQQALEDWFRQVDDIETGRNTESVCCYLVDATEAHPPIRSLFEKARQRILRGNIPCSKTAVLYRRGALVTMIQILARRLPQGKQHQIRLFPVEERSDAMTWLSL